MSFHDDIRQVLNKHSRENKSGTPDHVLATVMVAALESFERQTNQRDRWWGFNPKIGGTIPAKEDGPNIGLQAQ